MTKDKFVLAIFDDEEPLMEAVRAIQATGTKIFEVYTPLPVHGLDEALGMSRSRLTKAAFLFGSVGFTLGLTMQSFMLGFDKWRINIGGKNYLAWPDFIPVTFELTVLITALGMVATYLLASYFFPGAPTLAPHPRVTSDRFVIAMRERDIKGNIASLAKQHGALEVTQDELTLN